VTPADEIRAAADRLRELAGAVTPGAWTAHLLPPNEHHRHPAHWVKTEYAEGDTTSLEVIADCPWRQADADYIAAMDPAVGKALADWLDDAANGDDYGEVDPHALAIARLINQETT